MLLSIAQDYGIHFSIFFYRKQNDPDLEQPELEMLIYLYIALDSLRRKLLGKKSNMKGWKFHKL